MVQSLRFAVALLLLAVGVFSFWYLRAHPPAVAAPVAVAQLPLVEVMPVQPKTQRIPIELRGLVSAASEVVLAAETQGVVTQLSNRLQAGANFRRGEFLLAVDDRVVQQQLSSAQANRLSLQNRLQRIKAEQSIDQALLAQDVKSAYQSRLSELQAQLDLANSEVALAQQQLAATRIRAPFDGRVQQVLVSVGQRLAPGVELLRFYGTQSAKVRLAVSDRQLQLLDTTPADSRKTPDAPVILRQDLAGQYRYWSGHLLGLEASVDPRNQMAYLQVAVDKPFHPALEMSNTTLLTGQILEARVESRPFHNLSVLPRQYIQSGDFVWCVDAAQRLYRQAVQVVYSSKNLAYVLGLTSAHQVVTTPMNLAIEGMSVRLLGASNDSPAPIRIE